MLLRPGVAFTGRRVAPRSAPLGTSCHLPKPPAAHRSGHDRYRRPKKRSLGDLDGVAVGPRARASTRSCRFGARRSVDDPAPKLQCFIAAELHPAGEWLHWPRGGVRKHRKGEQLSFADAGGVLKLPKKPRKRRRGVELGREAASRVGFVSHVARGPATGAIGPRLHPSRSGRAQPAQRAHLSRDRRAALRACQEPGRARRASFGAARSSSTSSSRARTVVTCRIRCASCSRASRLAVNAIAMRRGSLFRDRHHRRELRTPTQTRNALVYVLFNERKHDFEGGGPISDETMSSLDDRTSIGWVHLWSEQRTPAAGDAVAAPVARHRWRARRLTRERAEDLARPLGLGRDGGGPMEPTSCPVLVIVAAPADASRMGSPAHELRLAAVSAPRRWPSCCSSTGLMNPWMKTTLAGLVMAGFVHGGCSSDSTTNEPTGSSSGSSSGSGSGSAGPPGAARARRRAARGRAASPRTPRSFVAGPRPTPGRRGTARTPGERSTSKAATTATGNSVILEDTTSDRCIMVGDIVSRPRRAPWRWGRSR